MTHSIQRLPSSLVSLLSSHIRPLPTRLGAIQCFAQIPRKHSRSYASAPPTAEETQKARAKMQLRMTEKAGRMKSHIGLMAALPAFANYVRPAELSKRVPRGSTLKQYWRYFVADSRSWLYDRWLMSRFGDGLRNKKSLGPEWKEHFLARSAKAYKLTNESFASGNFQELERIATPSFVDSIKAKRARSFPGLQLSWEVKEPLLQTIACVRQQELEKKGEFVAQIAVRFTAEQSLEIKNSKGDVIRERKPDSVTEYYVFQREIWKRNEDWKIIKSIKEVDPFKQDGVPEHEKVQMV